jgi:biotin carboxylase
MIDRVLAMASNSRSAETNDRPRVLILGGSAFQVPMIRYAKEQGAYVITCDYLPGNPGHALADEYRNVSITDGETVLKLARGLDVDAVLSFASEPALQTVSYVTEALGLPGPALDDVVKLTDKGAFRRLLREADLPVPHAVTVSQSTPPADLPRLMEEYHVGIPCIVKPIDSSGSKGITVLDATLDALPQALLHALAFSRSKRCIIEQYIEGDQIHGDGYLEEGRLVFHYLGDHVFFTDAGCRVPVSTRWPSKYGGEVVQGIQKQVEAISTASGYRRGPVNVEARVTEEGNIYIVEVSPRNGGNHVPIIIQHLTGFDFVRQGYLDATGNAANAIVPTPEKLPGAYYVLHSPKAGILDGVALSDAIRPHVVHLELFRSENAPIEAFRGSNGTIGVALLSFNSREERDTLMREANKHVKLLIRLSG